MTTTSRPEIGASAIANGITTNYLEDGSGDQTIILIHGSGPLAWTRWEFPWSATTPSSVNLSVRATDSAGNTQPGEVAGNKFGYQMNAIVTHTTVLSAATFSCCNE